MNAVDGTTLQERRDAAAALLDWLAGLLSAPMSVGTVQACRSRAGAALFDAIDRELGDMPGIAAMRAVLDTGERDEPLAARLSACYVRLFEGPGGPATVPLCESAYAGHAGRLQQQATVDMASMLRRCGMAVRANHREPPDHLSLEVALLATLLRIGDAESGDELRRRLLGWIPRAAAACAAADPTGFYRGVLSVVHDTLMTPNTSSTFRDPP